jgi:membrane dipeptidase
MSGRQRSVSEQDRRTEELHRRAIVIDAACPLVNPRDIAAYVPALQRGGVTCAFGTVASIEPARYALGALSAWYARAREFEAAISLASSAGGIEAAKRDGRIAIVLHFQGGAPLEYDPSLVEAFYRLGVRVIQLTYNERNPLGDGCTERGDAGLSKLGLAVIGEMNRLGMLVDLTHAGYRTSMEALEVSKAPAIFSHSNARALRDSPRNLPDDLLRAVARRGGVVGACAFPAFVTAGRATVEHLLDQIDYMSRLIGPEHIGLGMDFAAETAEDYVYFRYDPSVYPAPPWIYPVGIQGFGDFPNITRGLVDRGYADRDVLGIVGGNLLRVFREVCG